MTTPLYPTFEKRIGDAVDQLIRSQVDPWAFFNTGHPLRVRTFDGRNISYGGVVFDDSVRQVFWSRYMEPFLEDLAVQQIATAVTAARERSVDAKLLLPEIQGLLLSACRKVFARMARIDQRLLGRGFPENVPCRPIENEYNGMKEFIEKHIRAEHEMWRPKRRYEDWYERNKFWVWLLGTLVAIAGLVAKFL